MALNSHLCTVCGAEVSAPRRPGSMWIALALAVPFVIPGAVYLAWRYTTRRLVCPICAHSQLIPADAPLARTWRSAGWIAASPASGPTVSDSRIERIEQAIDAIALEVDRIAQVREPAPHPPALSPGEHGRRGAGGLGG